MTFTHVQSADPSIHASILAEMTRQSEGMELIASENYQSAAVLEAQSSVFANKYSEGFPGRRYYGGQENTDTIEQLAIDRAKKVFRADHANVQALSGAAANLCIYAALMEPGDTILGMDLSHGGHLTHGAPVTFFSKIFNFVRYGTIDGELDYDAIHRLAHEHKPKIILVGFSAFPRTIDFARVQAIADEIGAITMADMSHVGGFIAADLLPNPLDHGFHVMMTTTHKSLRGPRGALILSKGTVSNPLKKPDQTIENIPTIIDRAVFPGMQGGPHMQTIAAIAVALEEAQSEEFLDYARQSLKNAHVMAEEFVARGYQLVTGGTENHMIILDFSDRDYTGRDAERALDKIGISTSKSTIPDDPNPPFRPSGLRVGMPAMTTRGVDEDATRQIVDFMDRALTHQSDDDVLESLRQEVIEFCAQYPVPSV